MNASSTNSIALGRYPSLDRTGLVQRKLSAASDADTDATTCPIAFENVCRATGDVVKVNSGSVRARI